VTSRAGPAPLDGEDAGARTARTPRHQQPASQPSVEAIRHDDSHDDDTSTPAKATRTPPSRAADSRGGGRRGQTAAAKCGHILFEPAGLAGCCCGRMAELAGGFAQRERRAWRTWATQLRAAYEAWHHAHFRLLLTMNPTRQLLSMVGA
jgi:hypothetical protein